jgi:hypothetical protein
MENVQLNIERPELFEKAIDKLNSIYKADYSFRKIDDSIYGGLVDILKIENFYQLGRIYGQFEFLATNQLVRTGEQKKLNELIFQGNFDDILGKSIDVELLNKKTVTFKLILLNFAESSHFDRIFQVMSKEDKVEIERFVGIEDYHYKTSFVHPDYNINYQIIDGSIIFFKKFHSTRQIKIDSIIGIEWKH